MDAPWWMPLSNASRVQAKEHQREYYSGKNKQHTLKAQRVTDGEHRILAISGAITRQNARQEAE